jgi:hypothetical protein
VLSYDDVLTEQPEIADRNDWYVCVYVSCFWLFLVLTLMMETQPASETFDLTQRWRGSFHRIHSAVKFSDLTRLLKFIACFYGCLAEVSFVFWDSFHCENDVHLQWVYVC